MRRTVPFLSLLLAACGGQSAQVSAPPKGCDQTLAAYVANIGFAPFDVYLGGSMSGAVAPGNTGRFVLSPPDRYLTVRPAPTSSAEAGSPKYKVSYKCET